MPPPTPKPSSTLEIRTSPRAEPTSGSATTAGPDDDQVRANPLARTQTESGSAAGGSRRRLGEPTGKDPIVDEEQSVFVPGASGSGLTRKKAAEIDALAREALRLQESSPAEQAQEAEDIKLVKLLEAVQEREAKVAAGELPYSDAPPITLPEKVYHTINSGFLKLAADHKELLVNICNKRKEVKALKLDNSKLQVQKDEAEELLSLSFKLVDHAQDFKVLQSENAELREKLTKLKADYESSMAASLESSRTESERLKALIANRDAKILQLEKAKSEGAGMIAGLRSEVAGLKKERAMVNTYILAEAGSKVGIEISDSEDAASARNKARDLPRMIDAWKMSYARAAAQNALTLVMRT